MSSIRFGNTPPIDKPKAPEPTQGQKKVTWQEGLRNVASGALSLPFGVPFYGSAKHPLERDNPVLKWGYVGHKALWNAFTLGAYIPVMGTVGLPIGAAFVGARELLEYVLNPSQRKVMADISKEAHESQNPFEFCAKIGQALFHGSPAKEPTVPAEKTPEGKDTP